MIKKLLLGLLLGLALLGNAVFASFSVDVVSTNPAPITAGEYADITLRFTNIGSTDTATASNNVEFSIKKSDLFLPLDSEPVFFSKIFVKESVTKTFRVFFSEDLGEGFVDMPIVISKDGLTSEKKVRIYVQESLRKPELMIGDMDSTPNQLLRDSDDNLIKLTLLNLGDRDAELVTAKLVSNSSLIKASQAFSMQDSLSSIKAGSEGILEFEIDIEEVATAQVIPSSIELTYRTRTAVGDNYETMTELINFDLPIDESPFLVIDKVELLDDFIAGTTENRVLITIKNEGEEEAEDVRIRFAPDISFPLIFSQTSKYLTASLQPGESANMEFDLEIVSTGDAGDYASKVILESMVGESRYSQDSIVTITTKASDKASGNSTAQLLILIVILVSAFIGYRVWKGKKSSSKK